MNKSNKNTYREQSRGYQREGGKEGERGKEC